MAVFGDLAEALFTVAQLVLDADALGDVANHGAVHGGFFQPDGKQHDLQGAAGAVGAREVRFDQPVHTGQLIGIEAGLQGGLQALEGGGHPLNVHCDV